MSNLILPQKWTSQPQTPVQIDWSNPLTQGLIGAINAGAPVSTRVGNPPFVATAQGIGHNANGSSYLVTNATSPIASAATIFFVGNLIHNTTGIGGLLGGIGTNSSGSQLFIIQNNNYPGTAKPRALIRLVDAGGVSTAESATLSVGASSTAIEAWAATYAGTAASITLYRNGVDDTGGRANSAASGSATSFNRVCLGGVDRGTDGFSPSGQITLLSLAWNRALSPSEIKSLSKNPWQIFERRSRRIWVGGLAGGGDATATITGVSGSAQVGTVSTSGNASVSLPGASGAGSVGNVVASVSAATAITGVNGAGQVGNTTQTGAANVAVSTVAGTGQVGTVSASGIGAPDGNVAITGIAGTGQVGTLAAAGNAAVSIAGVSGAGSVGSVTPSVTVSTTITGVSGTGSVGTTTQTGTANTTVSSAVGTGLVGDVSAVGTSQNGNAVISGISGIGSVGIVSANDGTVVNNHGFIIIDTEPRLWWKRKPSKLDDKKAEEKIFKVARVIERVVKHVANSNEPSVSKEVYRKAAYAEVAPLLREMPGFDWSPMFRAILTQSKLQEQNRIAAEQAGILAKQEIERIKRIRDDEEALIVLLMGA